MRSRASRRKGFDPVQGVDGLGYIFVSQTGIYAIGSLSYGSPKELPKSVSALAKKTAKQLEPVSLVDRLVSAIRDSIIAGELESGSHIGIKKIADEYGVSMIPVREALARLLASRLVRVEANRGYFVASKPSQSEFAEFVEARELFETTAVARGFDNVTDTDIRQLEKLNQSMRKIAETGRKDVMVEWGNLNSDFHQVLVGLTRNSYLSSLYADLAFGNMHFQLARDVTTEAIGLRTLVSQHDEMIEAMKVRDRARLLACLSDHIKNLTRDTVSP